MGFKGPGILQAELIQDPSLGIEVITMDDQPRLLVSHGTGTIVLQTFFQQAILNLLTHFLDVAFNSDQVTSFFCGEGSKCRRSCERTSEIPC